MERLDDIVVGPRTQALDPLADVRFRGEHDDRDASSGTLSLTDALRRGIPIELGHGDVHQDQLGLAGARQLNAGLAIGCHQDLEPLLLEGEHEHALDIQIVVDDQDLGGSHQEPAGEKSAPV